MWRIVAEVNRGHWREASEMHLVAGWSLALDPDGGEVGILSEPELPLRGSLGAHGGRQAADIERWDSGLRVRRPDPGGSRPARSSGRSRTRRGRRRGFAAGPRTSHHRCHLARPSLPKHAHTRTHTHNQPRAGVGGHEEDSGRTRPWIVEGHYTA